MGILGSGRKRLSERGLEGRAIVKAAEADFGKTGNVDGSWELADFGWGTIDYYLTLEVHVPHRAPYELSSRFEVPAKAEKVSIIPGHRKHLGPGVELPIWADRDDASNIEVDWDRFVASPGRKQAMKEAEGAQRQLVARAQLDAKPELKARMIANNKIAGQAWAAAVKMGNLSREEFEKTVNGEVEAGRMNPADAEAARRMLD